MTTSLSQPANAPAFIRSTGQSGWRRLLAISTDEVSFSRRGFRDSAARRHLEEIGRTFLYGYHAALDCDDPSALHFDGVPPALTGFAFEGTAMAMALLDALLPGGRDRLARLLEGTGKPYAHLIHVGAGWAMARLPWGSPRLPSRPQDPLLSWLTVDGYGFHQGYFHPDRYLRGHRRPRRAAGYAARAFDQGLGRSVWFAEGAAVAFVIDTVAAFPPARQADLWSGIGLAATYAGGVDPAGLLALRRAAGPFATHLAQGAVFAAKARHRSGNVTEETAAAAATLAGVPVSTAVRLADCSLADLHDDGEVPSYEVWRRRIRTRLNAGERTRAR